MARLLLIVFHAAHRGRQVGTLGPPGTGKSTVTILMDAIAMAVEQYFKDVLLAPTNRTNQNLAKTWKDIAEEGTYAIANVSRHPAKAQELVVGIDRSSWADHTKAAVCVCVCVHTRQSGHGAATTLFPSVGSSLPDIRRGPDYHRAGHDHNSRHYRWGNNGLLARRQTASHRGRGK